MNNDLLVFDETEELGTKLATARPKVVCAADAFRAVRRIQRPTVCVTRQFYLTDEWRTSAPMNAHLRARLRLVVLDSMAAPRREFLRTLFGIVIARDNGVRLLREDDLLEVLKDKNRQDLLIGVGVDAEDKVLMLYRGDATALAIPFTWFRSSGAGQAPDFSDVEVIDGGQTVRLGKYEAAAEEILYELDAGYRRRRKEHQLHSDRSFGSALRRLRLQRRLARGDLGLSAKEVARLERGEVKKPHGHTLEVLAKHLKVKPNEIQTY